MKIRAKMLLLSLSISLLPLMLLAAVNWLAMTRIRNNIAAIAFDDLSRSARELLMGLVEDYARVTNRDRFLIEKTLEIQAREAESRLASEPPANPVIFLSKDYDAGHSLLEKTTSRKYISMKEGTPENIPVSFSRQVYVPVRGIDSKDIERQMAQLSTMPLVYSKHYASSPNLIQWMYTSMSSGFHSCYPGHGGYTAEYDPRIRQWFTEAVRTNDIAWTLLPDVSTSQVYLTCSMPVRGPDGRTAGVTAIDVNLKGVIAGMKYRLPVKWRPHANIFHVYVDRKADTPDKMLKIFIQEKFVSKMHKWEDSVNLESLTSDNVSGIGQIISGISAGESGVLRMKYQGKPSFWAFSPVDKKGELATIVILPQASVIERARQSSSVVQALTGKAIFVGAFTYIIVLLIVVYVAVSSGRRLTHPISELTDGANRLAKGDFHATVNIQTQDELEELGSIFNGLGPRLEENEKMKRSLVIASEVQQQLLPQGSPHLEGFDISGGIDYCDETGGDYYDFIQINSDESNLMGIAIGDITGHGIGAALLMASARAVLRSHASHFNDDLGQLFVDMNTHLYRDTGEERFLTLCYMVLEGGTRKMRYASAGHDPAIWFHAETGEIEELENTGIMLGALEDMPFTEKGPLTLQFEDVIVVGTDGIWEAVNEDGEMYGKDRLKEVIVANVSATSHEIQEAIIQSVREFCGEQPQLDDITVVVIKAV